MDRLRLRFSKTGRAKYISHLDLMRVMQRAFLRAGLPIKYSEGFNPHAVISIALPLSVGMESRCELLDFRLDAETAPEGLPEKLNAVLPGGIAVSEAYPALRKTSEIKWVRVLGELEYDSGAAADLTAFFDRDTIVIPKKTKRGTADADIRPAIRSVKSVVGRLELLISAREPALNPAHIVQAIELYEPENAPDFAVFRRDEIYDRDGNVFR